MPVFWWMGLDLVFLVARTASGDVFWGVHELNMILGSSLLMCGVVFLSCWLFGMGCPALELAGHCVELGLSVETEISGRALID